jgi:hypothetical protein
MDKWSLWSNTPTVPCSWSCWMIHRSFRSSTASRKTSEGRRLQRMRSERPQQRILSKGNWKSFNYSFGCVKAVCRCFQFLQRDRRCFVTAHHSLDALGYSFFSICCDIALKYWWKPQNQIKIASKQKLIVKTDSGSESVGVRSRLGWVQIWISTVTDIKRIRYGNFIDDVSLKLNFQL